MKIKKYTKEYKNLAPLFSCGNMIIDRFLQDGSALDANRGITYVMLSDEEDYIVPDSCVEESSKEEDADGNFSRSDDKVDSSLPMQPISSGGGQTG